MNKLKLNNLAVLAQAGDTEAMWGLKGYFQPVILHLSDTNRNLIASQERFENECYKIVEESVERFNQSLGDIGQLVVHSIIRRLGRTKKRHQKTLAIQGITITPIESMLQRSDDDSDLREYQIVDCLATVDGDYLLKEKIASLAGSDSRKLAILNTWISSDITDTQTADLLAQTYGGKAESHRKFITRFKSQCRTTLANAV
ncbi:hypothetical protein D3C71_976250 [compost metagenome]